MFEGATSYGYVCPPFSREGAGVANPKLPNITFLVNFFRQKGEEGCNPRYSPPKIHQYSGLRLHILIVYLKCLAYSKSIIPPHYLNQ